MWKAGENHGKINRKQKRFCDEYLIDLNATAAAIRAAKNRRREGGKLIEKLENI